MLERYNYFCLFCMLLDLILLRGNFFCKAKFHNNKYCIVIGKTKRNVITFFVAALSGQQSLSCTVHVAGTGNFSLLLIQERGLG